MIIKDELKAEFIKRGTFYGLSLLAAEYIRRAQDKLEDAAATDAPTIAASQAEIKVWRAITKLEKQIQDYAAIVQPGQQS